MSKEKKDIFGLLNKLHSSQFETSYLVMDIPLFQYSFTLSVSIIGWGFCDIRNNQGRGKCYQPKPKADNTYLDLDYSGYHKSRI